MRFVPALLLTATLLAPCAIDAQTADGWVKVPNSRVRLKWCGGPEGTAVKGATELAFLEMQLDSGWKTYWRNPGDSGVPPTATWDKSTNLASASFYFPAPHRFTDASGDAVGYKDRMILPLRVERADVKQVVKLAASFSYGICKNICVPVDIDLVAGCFDGGFSEDIAKAVEAVPRAPGQRRDSDPKLVAVAGSVVSPSPRLTIDVEFGAGTTGTDLFLEAPDGLYVPLPAPAKPDARGRARFTVDLSKTLDPKELAGKTLKLTMVSSKGASEAEWVAK